MDVERTDSPSTFLRAAITRRRTVAGAAAVGAALGLGRGIRTTAQEATPVPVQQTQDVVYGEVEGIPLLLDVFQPPAREAARPAVIVIHGGGFISGDRSAGYEAAANLAEAGYVAVNIAYRLFDQDAGTNRWPVQLDDAQRAVRWVRANAATYGVDPERIGSYGHSTGGTLAAMLGVREARDTSDPDLAGFSSRVTCVVDLAGDTDLTIPPPPVLASYVEQFYAALLGGTREEDPEAYRDASPLFHVDEESVPFLVIHAAEDSEVSVEHSRRLVEALHEAGVEVAYLELPDATHDDVGSWETSGPWVLTFLGVHLHPER